MFCSETMHCPFFLAWLGLACCGDDAGGSQSDLWSRFCHSRGFRGICFDTSPGYFSDSLALGEPLSRCQVLFPDVGTSIVQLYGGPSNSLHFRVAGVAKWVWL